MISLKTADNALKNVYLEVVNNQLNNELDPFYSKIEKTSQDITGKEIKKMVAIGINGGIGAGAEDGGLPKAQENNYAVLTSTLKNMYGQLEISDKALRASQHDSGAFLNLLNSEMENLIESSKFNLKRMIYGTGSTILSQNRDINPSSSVYQVKDARKFMIGMRINGIDGTEEVVSYLNNAEIIDVDYENNTITFDSMHAFPEDYEDDYLEFHLATSMSDEILGLGAVFNSDKILNLYGLDRNHNSFLNAYLQTIQEENFTYIDVLKAIDDIRMNYNGNIDFIVCGHKWRREYQKLLKSFTLNTDIVNLEGGYRAISVNGVPVIANRFTPDNYAYFIDSSTFSMHQLCDWTWLSNDRGEVLRQKEGYAAHTATLVKYCDLICNRPNRNGMIVLS
ncbi:MAG: phage major capsid protein [Clostridia bacterium]|nr:phage major capsid protein [Clostridia bacterium]